MRMDKLTSKFQMALADAQSLAVGRDHQFIEPAHLMAALLDQEGGSVRHLLTQADVNVNQLRSGLGEALDRLPQVQGAAGEVHVSNELGRLLNQTDKLAQQRKDQYISSELFVLAALDDRGELGQLLRKAGAAKGPIERAIEQMRGRSVGGRPQRRGTASGAAEVHHRPHRTGRAGQAGSGDRARRRNPPYHPGSAAAHQEQPGVDRRAGRGQDRHRGRPRSAHRQRRSAGEHEEQAPAGPGHGGPDRRGEVPRRVRGAPQGGAQRHRQAGGQHHPVHRRAAHHGWRRQGRRCDGCRQHAEAGLGPW